MTLPNRTCGRTHLLWFYYAPMQMQRPTQNNVNDDNSTSSSQTSGLIRHDSAIKGSANLVVRGRKAVHSGREIICYSSASNKSPSQRRSEFGSCGMIHVVLAYKDYDTKSAHKDFWRKSHFS